VEIDLYDHYPQTHLFLFNINPSSSINTIHPVKADIDINVLLDNGDAVINLDQLNGTAQVTVNNIDVIEEWQQAQQQASNYLQMVYYMSARNDVDDLSDELDLLQADLEELIEQLNLVLPRIDSRGLYMLNVIGVTHNSSDVLTNLRTLNMSVADYLEDHEIDIEENAKRLDEINKELDDLQPVIYDMIAVIDSKISENSVNTTLLRADLVETIDTFKVDMGQFMDDTDGKFIVMGCLSGGTIIMLIVLVWVQGQEYMSLKKRLDDLAPKEKFIVKMPPGLETIDEE